MDLGLTAGYLFLGKCRTLTLLFVIVNEFMSLLTKECVKPIDTLLEMADSYSTCSDGGVVACDTKGAPEAIAQI
ncbi:MAG: hypothetical protein KME38_23460 [Spirirestis rafaelensis WJT71-NPBG6]|nr:hypothetical protein [Spirirestis rafaelensis WJT71-NPBG6]